MSLERIALIETFYDKKGTKNRWKNRCRNGVGKRSCFVRFGNRNAIKWYIPISFFFALKKRSEMLVNKRVRGFGKLFEKIGVRYQVPKKFGFRGV